MCVLCGRPASFGDVGGERRDKRDVGEEECEESATERFGAEADIIEYVFRYARVRAMLTSDAQTIPSDRRLGDNEAAGKQIITIEGSTNRTQEYTTGRRSPISINR